MLAKAIHQKIEELNVHEERPFIAINVSALPSTLIERELFGSEKGAFTDSKERKRGYFELAHNGTLFFDEIGDISLELQSKLLKVIEEKTFYRLGGDSVITSNFKLICATHRNLEQMVQKHEFREDLYMRISTLKIEIPPLRERREDIPHLIQSGLPIWCKDNEVQANFEDLPEDLITYLKNADLKGNIRGIEQVISRLLVLSPKKVGGKLDFSGWQESLTLGSMGNDLVRLKVEKPKKTDLTQILDSSLDIEMDGFPSLDFVLTLFEKRIYESLVKRSKSNLDISTLLKVSPATVSMKLKKYNLRIKN